MIVRNLLALLTVVASIAASPAPAPTSTPVPRALKLAPVPNNAQTATLKRYLEAQKNGKYADAYALLNAGAKAYFRTADNYASVFTASKFALVSYSLAGTVAGGSSAFRLYEVKESVTFADPAHDNTLASKFTVPLGVIGDGASARIKDLGKPWKVFASTAGQTTNNLRVEVRKISFYEKYVNFVVLFSNVGDSFVTLLPYGRTVLRDETGTVYPLISLKNWDVTDRRLFLGVRLAPNAQYAGALSFRIPKPDDVKHTFTLTVAPSLRDGPDEPFSTEVTGIVAGG